MFHLFWLSRTIRCRYTHVDQAGCSTALGGTVDPCYGSNECIKDGTPQTFPADHPRWGHCQLGYSTAGASLITVTAPLDPRCHWVCRVVSLGSGYTSLVRFGWLGLPAKSTSGFSSWSRHYGCWACQHTSYVEHVKRVHRVHYPNPVHCMSCWFGAAMNPVFTKLVCWYAWRQLCLVI